MQEELYSYLSPFLISLVVSLGIGLIIGIQRELETLSGKEHFAGLRGFSIMSMLGCVIAFLGVKFNNNLLLFVAPAILVLVSVIHYSKPKKEDFGVVTELSMVLVFFLGVLSGLQFIKEALAVAVIVSALLALKDKFSQTMKQITQEEFYAFIKFIVITLLIMPFLPDKNFGPGEVINPLGVGFAIVTVSTLSFIGYFVIKFFGTEKGILFTAFFGGTVSSTAVSWVFSTRSKETENLSLQYALGIIIACTVMFLRVLLVSVLFNAAMFRWLLVPVLLMLSLTLVIIFYLRHKVKENHSKTASIDLGNPLELGKMLLFGLLYIVVTLIVYYANLYFNLEGLFITGFITGLADVDAVNISVSKLSVNQIAHSTATIIILLAILSNTMIKMGVAFLRGSRKLKWIVFVGLLPSAIIASLSVVWVYSNYR